MRLTSRLSISLVLCVAAVSLAFAFYQTRTQSQSMQRELQERTLLLGDNLARAAEPLLEERRVDALEQLVERFKDREGMAGVAVYDDAGTPVAATKGLVALLGRTPQPVSESLRNGRPGEQFLTAAGKSLHVAVVPLCSGGTIAGALAIVHDTAISTRASLFCGGAPVRRGVTNVGHRRHHATFSSAQRGASPAPHDAMAARPACRESL